MALVLSFVSYFFFLSFPFLFSRFHFLILSIVGRTGRAGRMGKAITLFTLSDRDSLRTIANVMKASGCDVPEYLLKLKAVKKRKKNKSTKSATLTESTIMQ